MQQRTTKPTPTQQNRSTSPQANRATGTLAKPTGNPPNGTGTANAVVCQKCKSPQIVANKRGYSFANMFKTLGWMALLPLLVLVIGVFGTTYLMFNSVFSIHEGLIAFIAIICWISLSLSLPVSILVGFAGRNEIVNGCMNCGFKWTPARKKK